MVNDNFSPVAGQNIYKLSNDDILNPIVFYILDLKEELVISNTIKPISLAVADIDKKYKYKAIGFGPKIDMSNENGSLNYLEQKLASEDQFGNFDKNEVIFFNTSLFDGDLHGPIIFNNTLYGISSKYETNKGNTIYFRTNTERVRNWISFVVEDVHQPKTTAIEPTGEYTVDLRVIVNKSSRISYMIFSIAVCYFLI